MRRSSDVIDEVPSPGEPHADVGTWPVSAIGRSVRCVTSSGPAPTGSYEVLAALWLRLRLFAISYAPVLAIFALKSDAWWAKSAYGVAAACALLDGYRLSYGQAKRTRRSYSLQNVTDKGSEVSGYLATYLLPFLVGAPGTWWDAAAYLVYFLVALLVFLNSDLLLINPTLYVLGWRVAQGTTGDGREVIVLTRDVVAVRTEFEAALLGTDLVRFPKPTQGPADVGSPPA